MEKRKCLTFLFCLILCYSLFHIARAQSSSQASIFSQGSITYSPSNVNLAVIPDDWGLTYGSGPQIIFLDYGVEHTPGNPSIRLEPHTAADVNVNRECDGTWYPVKPGDHIVAKVWIKTNPSSLGDTQSNHGGRIGIDFYTHTSAGYGIVDGCDEVIGTTPPGSNIPGQDCVLSWNNSIWTQKGWDVIVPTAQYTTVHIGSTVQTCNPVQIDSLVVWLDVRPVADAGLVWFADAELYINPT